MLLDRRDRVGNLSRTVPVRILLTAKRSAFDIAVLLIAAALYALNAAFLKPAFAGVPAGVFFAGYFNDILGGAAFLAYTNALVCLYDPRRRLRRFVSCVAYISCCGLFWEFAAPCFVADSTADVLDLVAYVVGAVLYWASARCTSARCTSVRASTGQASSELRSSSSRSPEKRQTE